MNKANVQKLKLFLSGLSSRLSENKDFFIDMKAEFVSGTKKFIAEINLVENAENTLKIRFNADTKDITFDEFPSHICNIASQYDSLILNYFERGETLTITGDERNVTFKNTRVENKTSASFKNKNDKFHDDISSITNRNYYVKTGEAKELLKEIGIIGENGKVKNDMIRKYNQIDHFIELAHPLLLKLASQNDTINVVDAGCGKSYLTFVLNYYIKEVLKKTCTFTGIDISENVIEESRKMASNLNYRNMEFHATDIKNFTPTKKYHLLISLHACDTATDEAIAFGIRNEVSSMVVVPCCHKELLSQYKFKPLSPITKHGIFKARLADTLTDGLRCVFLEAHGYNVSAVEYISPLETPKNIMISAIKERKSDQISMNDFKNLAQMLGVNLTITKLIY